MDHILWKACQAHLERELSEHQLSTWIRPLQAVELEQGLEILA